MRGHSQKDSAILTAFLHLSNIKCEIYLFHKINYLFFIIVSNTNKIR